MTLAKKNRYKEQKETLKEIETGLVSISNVLQNLIKMSAVSNNGKLTLAT